MIMVWVYKLGTDTKWGFADDTPYNITRKVVYTFACQHGKESDYPIEMTRSGNFLYVIDHEGETWAVNNK